jgi:hypothetical protein
MMTRKIMLAAAVLTVVSAAFGQEPTFNTGIDSAVSESKWLECAIARETEFSKNGGMIEWHPLKSDIYKISIEITVAGAQDPESMIDLKIIHHDKTGKKYNRAEQYKLTC